MKRGDLLPVVYPGDYGKPRPAVVIQSDLFESSSVLVCPLTSDLLDVVIRRITIEPSAANGLREASQLMVEKLLAVRRDKCGSPFGTLEDATMRDLETAMSLILGLVETA